MNILLLTSCNRIKQVLLSLSINAQIIEERFSVVIVDSSTPGVDAEKACAMHQSQDPYNVVKPHNYCSDVDMLYDAAKWFPQVEQFKVLHFSPRLDKQRGEATSIGLGLMQAALMGGREQSKHNFCLKLTGTSILMKDMVSVLPEYLAHADALTWHRANIGGEERSTRIFGCRPDVLAGLVANEGWGDWCDDATGILEQRFAKFLNRSVGEDRINYTGLSEDGFLLEGGMAMQDIYGRYRIEKLIEQFDINTYSTPYLKEFAKGGIWQ